MQYSPSHTTGIERGRSFNVSRWILLTLLLSRLLWAADPPSPGSSSPSASGPLEQIHVLDLSADARFNYMDREGSGTVTDRGMQYRVRTRIRLDARKDGTTYFTVRAETGKGFDNSWNNTGVGLGTGQSIFNIKAISVHQNFGRLLQAEAGGLDFDRGAGTDATSASGDGHMTGYRMILSRHSGDLPDKVSFTAGYVGDFEKPNFFSRARMDEVNYLQLLAEQDFHERVRASAELDSLHNVLFTRGAVQYSHLRPFDNAILEAMGRSTDRFRLGWSSRLGRHWGTNAAGHADLIYTDLPSQLYVVDNQRVLFNRGEFDVGKRLAVESVYNITKDLEIGTFAGRLLDSTPSKRWIGQAGIRYQFAGLANRLLH